jgi:hypothetical protein
VNGPRVVGEPAGERLMRTQDVQRAVRETGLTAKQVAAVLHGLADHTALMAASEYSQPEDGFWPVQTSIGRWLHDTAFQLERAAIARENADVQTFTEADAAVLDAVAAARVTDDLDYTGLFDYEDDGPEKDEALAHALLHNEHATRPNQHDEAVAAGEIDCPRQPDQETDHA